ncbi:MAG: hypothetical protein OET79_11140, partial [Nitrospirota bacterium]|nr:hypothetical protein [Nitrospirota bacterium]
PLPIKEEDADEPAEDATTNATPSTTGAAAGRTAVDAGLARTARSPRRSAARRSRPDSAEVQREGERQ